MKAIQINKYGGPEVIVINQDAPKPAVEAGKIVVEVHAASLNRIDSVLRRGAMRQMFPLQFPHTLGGDFAGVVSEVGEGVADFKVGNEVYGQAGVFLGGSGSLAEFALASVEKAATKPNTIDMIKAASLPLVGASAIQGIEDHIHIKKGQKLLIHGGAGGIGSLAIQIAKLHGAYVATTVNGKDMDFVKRLGADKVIDYKTQDFTQILGDFDAVFDTVGGETTTKSFAVIKQGGILVSTAGQPDQELAKRLEVIAISQMTQASTGQLNRISELVDSGKLAPQIDKEFSFDESKAAFEYFDNQSPNGKVVVALK